jgi:hypothetical protein
MDLLFQQNKFVIKRRKLSTDKLRVFTADGKFLMYAEQKVKWAPPFTATIRVFADEQKQRELLVATDSGGREYQNFLEVTDPVSGESVGGIGVNAGFFKDGWKIMDPQGAVLAEIREPGLLRSIVRSISMGAIAQRLVVAMGDETVATMRQKHALVGNKLLVDILPGASTKLDKRLIVAAAVFVAAYQAKQDLD